MKELTEIVQNLLEKETEYRQKEKEYYQLKAKFIYKIGNMQRLNPRKGINEEKMQIAEELLYVKGDINRDSRDIWGEDSTLMYEAIVDIINDCKILRDNYLCNTKLGDNYYIRDYKYWTVPESYGIVDIVGFKNPFHKLTSKEKDVCIYYLLNYHRIKTD